MSTGGARNRSGPPVDPNSGRSERRGLTFRTLPRTGYEGKPPRFPLPALELVTEAVTKHRRSRELALWRWAWTTPQAVAWSEEPWRWHTIAMWVRVAALCESSAAKASDRTALHRFADQIGLTPAGLRENGWHIPGVGPASDEDDGAAAATSRPASSRSRLRVVKGGG